MVGKLLQWSEFSSLEIAHLVPFGVWSVCKIGPKRDRLMRFKPTAIEWCVIVSIIGVLIALLLPGPDFDATHQYPAAIPTSESNLADDAVISGDEPRNGGGGTFFLRAPREPVVGIPDLPEQWANYLKDNVVIARIIEVRDGGLVKIDAGKSNGVPTAHGVLAVQGRGRYHPIRLFITSVADDTSIARLPDLPSQAPPLAVGQYVVVRK
jgi:hypothetical protein